MGENFNQHGRFIELPWSEGINNEIIYFKWPLQIVNDSSTLTNTSAGRFARFAVGPENECVSCLYSRKSSTLLLRNSKESGKNVDDLKVNLFRSGITVSMAQSNTEDRDYEEAWFDSFFAKNKPLSSADPFYLLGIDLFCARDMQSIMRAENIEEPCQDDVPIKPVIKEFSDVLKTFTRFRQEGKTHFLSIVLEALACMKKSSFDEHYSRHISDFIRLNSAEDPLFDQLASYLSDMVDWQQQNDKIVNSAMNTPALTESDLQDFLFYLLNVDGKCHRGRRLILKPFSNVSTHKDISITEVKALNLLYQSNSSASELTKVPIILSLALMKSRQLPSYTLVTPDTATERESASDVLTDEIDTSLLWQVFEQLLGLIIRTEQGTTRRSSVVFQPGLLVNNDLVKVVVLCLNTETLKMLQSMNSVQSTLPWLLWEYCQKQKMWGRLYLDATNYHISDIVKVAKKCHINFGASARH